MCEATMSNTANAPRLALRAGVDRMQHWPVCSGEGCFEARFSRTRSCRRCGALEPVCLELLYAELLETRMEAAQALFANEVMARASDLPARFREHVVRAVGSVPAPAWAAHLIGALAARTAGRRVVGAAADAFA